MNGAGSRTLRSGVALAMAGAMTGALAAGCGSVVVEGAGGSGGAPTSAASTGGSGITASTATTASTGGSGAGGSGGLGCDATPAVGDVVSTLHVGGFEDEYLTALAPGDAGSFFVGGLFSGTVSLTSTEVLISQGDLDAMILRIEADGTLAWARTFAGAGHQSVTRVAAAPDGKLFVAGAFDAPMNIGDGIVIDAQPGRNAFVGTLDAAGAPAALVAAHTTGEYLAVTGLAVTPEGGVLASGAFNGDLQIGPFSASGTGNTQGFLVMLDAAGEILWTMIVAPTLGGTIQDVATVDGGFAVAGGFQGSLTLGGDALEAPTWDGFLAKVDASGSWLSARSLPGDGDEQVERLAVDPSGRLYAAGTRIGPGAVDLGLGPVPGIGAIDTFVMAMAPDGSVEWASMFGDPDGILTPLALSATCAGEVLVAGDADGAAIGVDAPSPGGAPHGFVAKLGGDGAPLWGHLLGGQPTSSVASVLQLGADRVFAAGSFTGLFEPGVETIQSLGGHDAFVVWLSP